MSDKGSFTACSFWYAECLARCRQTEKAHEIFERTLGYGNHLGLFAEELGSRRQHQGNFPQALTHLALISAAPCLDASRARWPNRPGTRNVFFLAHPNDLAANVGTLPEYGPRREQASKLSKRRTVTVRSFQLMLELVEE
jgi:hypothetical protein